MFSKIRKRNGQIVDFDRSKITRALQKAGEAAGEFDAGIAATLSLRVMNLAMQMISDDLPEVEKIKDFVE